MGRQLLFDGPTRRCPSSQEYSILEPMAKPGCAISVEFGGCSGFPHVIGRCWQMKFSRRRQLVSDQSQPLVPSKRAQLSLPPGRFQKETETGLPVIHFQFLGSSRSRTAPSQYWPLASPCEIHFVRFTNSIYVLMSLTLCLRQSSHERKPWSAGLDSSTSVPPRSLQKLSAFSKLVGCWL